MITNLAQFKKAVARKEPYRIVQHYLKPELSGTRRQPTKVQTNGYYSIDPDDPESKVSTANGGLGYWNKYGKASEWVFEGEEITQLIRSRCAPDSELWEYAPLQRIVFEKGE